MNIGDIVRPTQETTDRWQASGWPRHLVPYRDWRGIITRIAGSHTTVRWTACPNANPHPTMLPLKDPTGHEFTTVSSVFELVPPSGSFYGLDRSTGSVAVDTALARQATSKSYRYSCDTCFGTGEVAVCVPCPKGCARR